MNEKYLKFSMQSPDKSEMRKLVAYILNLYFNQDLTYKQRKKLKMTEVRLNNGKTLIINLNKIVNEIIQKRCFNPDELSLPPLRSQWLDEQVNYYATTARNSEWNVTLPYGKEFPIKPSVRGTGVIHTTFQMFLQKDIINKYKWLIENSDKSFDNDGVWINEFRIMINDCISVVDITLHQLYFFAEYQSKTGWMFDSEKLGKRNCVRFEEKFKWIYKITGKSLDDAENEKRSFKTLKELRNHLNHFDPPCFAYVINDLVNWFNMIPDIGRLLWKIRDKLDEQLTEEIISIITLPIIEITDKSRDIDFKDTGYITCQNSEKQDNVI